MGALETYRSIVRVGVWPMSLDRVVISTPASNRMPMKVRRRQDGLQSLDNPAFLHNRASRVLNEPCV